MGTVEGQKLYQKSQGDRSACELFLWYGKEKGVLGRTQRHHVHIKAPLPYLFTFFCIISVCLFAKQRWYISTAIV